MRNFKTQLFTFLLILLVFSCSDQNNENVNTSMLNKKVDNLTGSHKSFINFNDNSYKDQLPYVNGDYDISKLSLELKLKDIINSDNYSWEYFNKLYNEDFNVSEKQFISYIILAKKDLIGDFIANPNKRKSALVLKYTGVLVNSEYIGYNVLYNSLISLNQSNEDYSDYIQSFKDNISIYSVNDTFHKDFINSDVEGSNLSHYSKKIKSNYEFLNRINDIVVK
ncbi:hypothetical protein [uncultured Winogradskyella sp.]|uniref:hypothetical protein n=1 Tax=uncultured Winogradskyella sp. TaxID=395353 RepID=UPI00261B878D|nr:hypothetical protein [uncultured Winogradskyella sp.]